MGKIKKRGASGQAKNFITRTQAVRKLQISLPDFRRLCIFKGIYPREPRNKKKASRSSTAATTFYYTKDIQYLLHEPLLNKFREHKALSKKIARSLGRGEVGDAARLEKSGGGKISLDHIIKERYPTFVDALRDLDDALSLLFLFANLPSTSTVPRKTISLCQRLCHEFQHYIIVSRSLRKSFLSIKGIYYQATIQGQDILWLVPYKFVQRVTGDVDFRIMGTFVEFYTTLLGFVNFRLYTSIGLVYPPKFSAKSDELGGELGAYQLEAQNLGEAKQIKAPDIDDINAQGTDRLPGADSETQKKIDSLTAAVADSMEPEVALELDNNDNSTDKIDDEIDIFDAVGPGGDILPQPQLSNAEVSSLFADFTFYLSRETPRQPLEFILRAFGCKRIGWDTVLGDGAFTNNESDSNITHQVVDRPPVVASSAPDNAKTASDGTVVPSSQSLPSGYRVPGRIYVQPQWVWDCINQGRLIRPDQYAPGAILPAHLSPWVKPKKGAYDPSVPLEEQELEGEAEAFEEEEAEAAALAEEAEGSDTDMENELSDADEAKALESDKHDPTRNISSALSEDAEGDDDLLDNHGMDIAGSDDSSDGELEQDAEDFDGFDDDENAAGQESADEAEVTRDIHQLELEAEAAGLPFSDSLPVAGTNTNDLGKPLRGILKVRQGDDARRKIEKKRLEEAEELQRRMGMMSRKKRKLMEKMMYGKQRDEEEAEALRRKRRRLQKENGLRAHLR